MDSPVMAGHIYRRVGGPKMLASVARLNGEQAMCAMFFDGRWHNDLRPIPCSLLRTSEFRLLAADTEPEGKEKRNGL